MKIRMYMDVLPGVDPTSGYMMAMSKPGMKMTSAKRIAFDVVIPDALLFDYDGVAPEVSQIGLVADKDIPHA